MTSARGLFSSSYWAFHRNSLLLSLALLLVSLPGVTLGPNQTVAVFQVVHLPGDILNWAVAIAATYALIAYLLEWRQEAYGFFLTEHGLLEDRQGQVNEVVQAIKSQIEASEENKRAALEKLDEVKNTIVQISDQYGTGLQKVTTSTNTDDETSLYITDAIKEINSGFHEGVSTLINTNKLPTPEMIITHAEIGPRVHSSLRELVRKILVRRIQGEFRPNLNELIQTSQEFVALQTRSIESASRIVDPLEKYGALLASIRRRLLRDKWLTTSRVWGFGAIIPVLFYLVAIAHFIGQRFFHIAPAISEFL